LDNDEPKRIEVQLIPRTIY